MESETLAQPGHRAEKPVRGIATETRRTRDLDELRVIGLSRIPRCAACPRLEALRKHLLERIPLAHPWAPAPRGCRHQVCAPLLRRFA